MRIPPFFPSPRRREGKGDANFRMIINKMTLKVNLTLNRIPIENQLEMIYFGNNLIRLFCIVATHEEDVL